MKLSAYKFESGKESLTNQVRNLGLRVLVVGRDGQAYDPEHWHRSNTFWQSREENLLVADNQTEFGPPANYFGQQAANAFAGTTLNANESIEIRIVAGSAIVYATTVDNRTNDSSIQVVRK
jgi:hypothetical protein